MPRFFGWFNSHPISGRWRSSSSVAPSVPSSGSNSQEKLSSLGLSNSTTTKQVHFADDCGGPLESVHIIPLHVSQKKTFHENLEEAFIDSTGIVTGILNIRHLEPGRNILVRYTENGWKSYKQTKARRLDKTDYQKVWAKCERNNRNDVSINSDSYERTSGSGDEVVKFAFCFKVVRKKVVKVELVIISTLDGAVDQRHEQGYKLSKSFRTVPFVTSMTCWG